MSQSVQFAEVRVRRQRWAQQEWNVYRQQYWLGRVIWSVPDKQYQFAPVEHLRFDGEELAGISRFLKSQTKKHLTELTQRKELLHA